METPSQYSIEYKSNNQDYLIELSTESNVLVMKFTERNTPNIIPSLYLGKFSFNELKEANKFLRIYDSIEELSQFFKDIINQKKLSIEKELNDLKTTWSFIKGLSEDAIILILSKKNMEKDDIISTLVNEIKILKAENIKVNEKLSNLEKRVALLENKKVESDNEKGLINKIITNKNEAKEFSKFLFNNNNTQFELLYQATRDGDKIDDIEKKVSGYSPLLFLLYTKKGIKCGGYTKAVLKKDSQYKFDESSFLYNFNTRKIINIKNPKEAIICRETVFCFGNSSNSDYYIRNSFLTAGVYEHKIKSSYSSNDYEVQGENESTINELEIYFCKH